jgi:hypothetical protein
MTSPRQAGSDDGGDDPLLEGPGYSTREGSDDRACAEVLAGKLTTLPPEGAIEWSDDIVRVPVSGIAIEGELAHARSWLRTTRAVEIACETLRSMETGRRP